MEKQAPTTIDAYLEGQMPAEREILESLRQIIKSMVPGAVEGISYQIPVIKYMGSPLVGFAGFAAHCGFYLMSLKVMEDFKPSLKGYDLSKGTIRFKTSAPLPESLVRDIVAARMKEMEAAKAASALKKTEKSPAKKQKSKPEDAEVVEQYLEALEHPFKAEILHLRSVVKNADPRIKERIKWNAPSYYDKADLFTFHPKDTKRVCIVFHHPAIVRISSDLLQGDYKDRRLAYFDNMAAIKAHETELALIIRNLLDFQG